MATLTLAANIGTFEFEGATTVEESIGGLLVFTDGAKTVTIPRNYFVSLVQ